jgi:CRISPR type III-B/RAMP module RAMP protein Cmr1
MRWTTVHLQVTTPLFNGGAAPDNPHDRGGGIRVPSLRGAMRFWFRALAGRAIGGDLHGLAALERLVFGGTSTASAVKLRIPTQPPLTQAGQPYFVQGDPGRWIVYLLGQGLGDLRRRSVTRVYVAPGEVVDLQLRFSADQRAAALAVASLWLLCAYGGVGARTRRGFGGLRIVGADGPLPDPWDATSIRSPGLGHYERLEHLAPTGPVEQANRHLHALCQDARVGRDTPVVYNPAQAWPAPPSYPVLSARYTRAGVTSGEPLEAWQDVLADAGRELRHFRASEPYPAAPYPPPKIKTPEWTRVVTGPDQVFGLGALGLPVSYKAGYAVNADVGQGSNPLRRASPLWLRPVGDERTRWRLLSFAFQGEFLPRDRPGVPAVHVWHRDRRLKEVEVPDTQVIARTNEWIDRMRQGRSFVGDPPGFLEA